MLTLDVVTRQPLVVVVITMAAKEEVRQLGIKCLHFEEVWMDGQVKQAKEEE